MSKVNRGEKILNRLVSEQKITPQGKDWIIAALDPFHDSQLDSLEGWPDMECGASVVRCVKKSITVSVPTALAGQNWDCHVYAHPILTTGGTLWEPDLTKANTIFANPTLSPVLPTKVGGLQVVGCKAGERATFTNTTTVGSENILMANVELDSDYTVGSGRLIGMGFEVHNTTSQLYKQGSCVVYRMQAENRDPVTYQIVGLAGAADAFPLYSNVSCQNLRCPPQTTDEAMLLQGSRQWEAADGCYVVSAFSSEENPAFGISECIPIMNTSSTFDNQEGNINTPGVYVPRATDRTAPYGAASTLIVGHWAPVRVHPIHQSGAIFSGLSPQSTLTVNVNFFYESFPSPADQAILVLAKPSCKYDPCVMELYSRLVQELPVGVPVAENGLGDWFLDAASKAAKFLGPVLTLMPHPIAKGAGAALTYLGETGQDFVKKQNQFVQPPNSWESQSGMNLESKQISQLNNRVKQLAKNEKKTKKKLKKTVKKTPGRGGR